MAVSKRTGRKSLAANDFLVPLPPGPPEASDVGTNRPFNNGAAVVNFISVPLAVSYKVYADTSGETTLTQTGLSSPIVFTGLLSNRLYTFTVTGVNDAGVESSPSDPSTPTLITTVPATPAAPQATSPSAGFDTVTWTAPASGGKTISGYIWTASDGKTNLAGGNPGGGPTTNTSVTVAQEQGTAQTYRVYAINPNGNSLNSPDSNSVTTTFSFAPFGFTPFGFTPFSFTPFGFTPFSFTPFSFTPMFAFTPFSFTPFGFAPMFSFAPMGSCIAAKTKLATINENGQIEFVMAKDIVVGTKVISPAWDEFKSEEIESPYESNVTYLDLTNLRVETGEIVFIKEKIVDTTVILNDNIEKRYSATQPLLIIKDKESIHSWVFAKDVNIGDTLWEYNFDTNQFIQTVVEKTELIVQDESVYAFDVKDFDTFIAGGIVCHNIRKV